jgi:DNA-binding LacI/PurR family transcriptional regulator
MANIKDLAKMAGVSKTTVSRVLNNHQYVSEEKKNAVLRAIESTNYQKIHKCSSFKQGKNTVDGCCTAIL